MRSWSAAVCVLIFLRTTFTTAISSVKVKPHDSATLPCSERCSGVVRWTMFHKPTEVLVICDQSSCRSVKEGYQMNHEQYLKENFSLIITDADFSKRARYVCDCDGRDVCDVHLLMEPLNSSVWIKQGEPLLLDFDIPEEVNFTGPFGQICTVEGRSLNCNPEYTQRVSTVLKLRELTPSDSGVYSIRDKFNKKVIHTYTVTVESAGGGELKGDQSDLDTDKGAGVPVGVVLLVVIVLVLVCVIVGLLVVIVRQRRVNQRLKRRIKNSEVELDRCSNHSSDQQRLSNHTNDQNT